MHRGALATGNVAQTEAEAAFWGPWLMWWDVQDQVLTVRGVTVRVGVHSPCLQVQF